MSGSEHSDQARSTVDHPEASIPSRASEAAWAVMDGTAFVSGSEFFAALVRHLARALQVPHAFVAECTDESKRRVRTLAFWSRDRLVDNIEFDVEGTPCKLALAGKES